MEKKLLRLIKMLSKYALIGFLVQSCVFTLLFAREGNAQKTRTSIKEVYISFHVKDASLMEVFTAIENKTDYQFTVDKKAIDKQLRLNINLKNISVAELLTEIARKGELRFLQVNENISVKKSAAKKSSHALPVQVLQEVTVSGKVTDEKGLSLPGVSILIKGSSRGTTSDYEGNFRFNVPEGSVLVFSSIGYVTQEVELGNSHVVNIVMQEDATTLDEVVVVGYGEQKKINLSGAVDAVGAEVLEDRPIANISSGLQGSVANLNIIQGSGQINSAPRINIRGVTSINSGNGDGKGSPLILVDNVPVTESELVLLNPNDIASISVLKDASSAAIYGARAAFGVVLITTKNGTSKDLKVTYNANYGTKKLTRRPEVVTNPYQVMKYKDVMAEPWYDLYQDVDFAYGQKRVDDPSAPAVIVDPNNPEAWKYYGATDWFDEIYTGSSTIMNHNISVSKSVEEVTFYLSGDYTRQEGMLRYGNDIYDRYNFRGKVDVNLTDWLVLKNNTSFTYSEYDEPEYGGWLFFHNVNRSNSLNVITNPDGSYTKTGASMIGSLKEGGRSNTWTNDFQSTFSFDMSLIKDVWSLKGDATFRRSNDKGERYQFPLPYRLGPGMPLKRDGNSSASSSNTYTRYNVYNIYTNLRKTFGKHAFNVLAGFNQEYKTIESFSASTDKLISTNLPSVMLIIK
ncbi:SusC/RagA family TonB-linked outer membrane protein [Rapidithrix thailandica]|uniref:SusC/RagA family TonB-linked outer membrane protein n=1 Tax=Rapidithrix thailandica TaxID=413964 RepID=A0AAW9SI29_9BACT